MTRFGFPGQGSLDKQRGFPRGVKCTDVPYTMYAGARPVCLSLSLSLMFSGYRSLLCLEDFFLSRDWQVRAPVAPV